MVYDGDVINILKYFLIFSLENFVDMNNLLGYDTVGLNIAF